MHIHFIRNYLDLDFADRLFEGLKGVKYNSDEESVVKIMGKSMMIPRKQVAFGEPGTDYHFSGTSVRAYDWNSEDSSFKSQKKLVGLHVLLLIILWSTIIWADIHLLQG